jgi:hypothetical protein
VRHDRETAEALAMSAGSRSRANTTAEASGPSHSRKSTPAAAAAMNQIELQDRNGSD